MKVLFTDLIQSMTKSAIAKPDYSDFLASIGVDPQDWPEVKVKSLLTTYKALREKDSHEYASYMLADDARGLTYWENMPTEPLALKALYANELRRYRFQSLGNTIAACRSPEEIEAAINKFETVKEKGIKTSSLFEQIGNIIANNEANIKAGSAIVTIPEWPKLSEMIGGFNPGRITLIIAETGFGKTNLSLALARSCAKFAPTLFVNMEMTEQDLAEKMLMGELSCSFTNFKQGRYDLPKIERLADDWASRKLLYTDGRALSIEQIFAVARREAKNGMRFMFVDYDQKIKLQTDRNTPEWKALQLVVEQLEELAKELNIWIGMLSQSNEDGDPSGSKRSKYPAATVLRFYKSDGRVVVQAIKNRFGVHGAAISIDYDPSRAIATEKERVEIGTFNKKELR